MLKILNELGNPFACEPDEIKIVFPYDGNRTLVKDMKSGVSVVNRLAGEFKVEFTDFEIQGLNIGERQSFVAMIKQGLETFEVAFPGALSVVNVEGRKSIV